MTVFDLLWLEVTASSSIDLDLSAWFVPMISDLEVQVDIAILPHEAQESCATARSIGLVEVWLASYINKAEVATAFSASKYPAQRRNRDRESEVILAVCCRE